MYISEIQQRLINVIDTSNNFLGCLALAINNGANRNEMTDTYHLALWFEGAPKEVKEKFIQLLELSGFSEIGLRICDNCGKFMTDGYLLFGMDEYACSRECAIQIVAENTTTDDGTTVTNEDAEGLFDALLEDYPNDNFWTEWMQEL